jgi:cellulose synthase operon protein C
MPPRSLPFPLRRAPAARRPARQAGSGAAAPPADAGVTLRLAIGREGIGLELATPARLGCLSVTELSATLPGIRFPVDVSGGVPRFRHRRGELQRLEVELGARALARWAAPRLRGLLGVRAPEVWIAVRPAAATVCIAAAIDPEEERPPPGPVLAFDLHALAEAEDLILVVEQARGADLPLAPTALAVACVEALLGGAAVREGCAFVLRSAAGAIVRALLPEAGARVPATDGVRWTTLAAASDAWLLHAANGKLTATPSPEGLRAREVALLLREGDDALVGGVDGEARSLYVDALGRAPRHPEITRRIVEIDVRAGGREEAALAMLVEARFPVPESGEVRFGTLPGQLRVATRDLEAALASLEHAGDTEPAPALAARAYEMAAREAHDPEDAARWLDRGLARAPGSITARWLRVTRRLQLGRLDDALADVEHLEAMARGGRVRHAVWLRAGRAWHAAGLASHAGALFERALRFVPDDARALAGLGAALVGEGRAERGVALLERALELAGARGEATAGILLDLGRALAEKLDDLPTGVARVSAIPSDAAEALPARALEGRWRASLGDLAGAALAFARLRELAAARVEGLDEAQGRVLAAFLREAADFERVRRHDLFAAQRHLAAALRLSPRDPELLRAYREAGALIARSSAGAAPDRSSWRPVARPEMDPEADPEADPEMDEAGEGAPTFESREEDRAVASHRPWLDLSFPAEADAGLARRIDDLTGRLQGDPSDDTVADELATLLEQAGRGHDLVALLSARLEEATPERRAVLAPRARSALERLAHQAESAGRREEAALYRSAIAASLEGRT